ncbi:MAG: hypothetical protein KF804_06380 [Burkholderiales bacterium]|nr:hypothetical protein [Burkholderiales bacterium]
MSPAMPRNPGNRPEDTATALALMSHYLRHPCPVLAGALAARLARLSQHCGDRVAPALQDLADSLLPQWRELACMRPH